MKKGKVYLVGAGPGDADLISVKAVKLLKQADIVLYDYLVNVELLDYCSDDCEKVYVGKRDKQHTYPQEEINRMLADYTEKYNCVVRLKGGDPFVFGRGVEEIQTMVANEIDYEVVPGITSGVAVPAYMGIPVTARNVASSVAFVTGHSAKGSYTHVDFQALAKAVDTLVVYMGVTNTSRIMKELKAGGKSGDTPVALIRWGTYPEQEMVKGTIGTIVSTLKGSGFKPPALMVVGEVVNFSDKLNPIVFEAKEKMTK
ncbi:uroporphyrin-III C-methyltransferase [Balneicella halophila]|uniref:uroporphyrinogen-III C-methyltransferase n=1 Tax=Balneicella halophila TaxID=1537566 RepID=A0A7L4UQY7_BALHA|nr:uroporphyrinogen-III C-methyltransferase [Balneicella halophila]PVX52163.1 uroporphyrin-III C-methyltransferase [Balneicella halophila]